jgi:hypothetical protein
MPQAKIEITPEALKSFLESLPPDVKIIGTADSLVRHQVLVFWIEGPRVPGCGWVRAEVTMRTIYDMKFEPAPARRAE